MISFVTTDENMDQTWCATQRDFLQIQLNSVLFEAHTPSVHFSANCHQSHFPGRGTNQCHQIPLLHNRCFINKCCDIRLYFFLPYFKLQNQNQMRAPSQVCLYSKSSPLDDSRPCRSRLENFFWSWSCSDDAWIRLKRKLSSALQCTLANDPSILEHSLLSKIGCLCFDQLAPTCNP